ncbi:MscL family protein [Mycoplasma bradburyae]|uniref:MscL family protein n=1 Tax=Mycoplasma bradburyae TaxID=2963128 RepID=A0AAW6HP60_9MOLU|nr:MscL family protein [Mycoplasma bradburyae]MDC4183099.1 MscL family protein [Mycoplasma bradburyae]UTS70666.1 MscL family protein [Mycoplasma bradburyae]
MIQKEKHISRAKSAIANATKVVKRGNIFMLAIGLLLGTSFNAVIASLANDVIIAAIAKLYNVSDLQKWQVDGIYIGKFFAAIISFVIINIILVSVLFIVYYINEIVKDFKKRKEIAKGLVEDKKSSEPTNEERIIQLLEFNNALIQQQIEVFAKAHDMKVEVLSSKFGKSVIQIPFELQTQEETQNLQKLLRKNAEASVDSSNWSDNADMIQ